MADKLVVNGTVRPRKAGAAIADYRVQVSLRAEVRLGDEVLRFPASASARLPGDGTLQLAVTTDGTPTGPVDISIAAPTGVEVHHEQFSLEQLTKPLRIRINTIDPVEVQPSDDPTLGARARIGGRVIDVGGRPVPPDLPVVISGVDRADGDAPPARSPI